MKKTLTILILTALVFYSCKVQSQAEKRKDLIGKFVSAVKYYDTIQVFELLDTSEYFRVQDKESLLFEIAYINSRLKTCGSKILDSTIKVKTVPVYSKEYTLPFCRGLKGEVIYDSFDLLFTFTDYDTDKKIHFVDIIKYRQNSNPTTKAAQRQ